MNSSHDKHVAHPPGRPLLIYDGDCNFCRFWIGRWRERTGRRVQYRRSQQVAARFPEIPVTDFGTAVQMIDPDGSVASGADAVFRAFEFLAGASLTRCLWHGVPGFQKVARLAYQHVARHRTFFSFLTRSLWGRSFRRPTFFIARWLFTRGLGAIYFVAFLSLLVQIRGLIGERGILPVAPYLEAARTQLGGERYWLLPTLCWFNTSDTYLVALCVAGMLLSLAVIFGWFPSLALALLWMLYLSLSVVSRTFLGYQWDALLLETGLLAIFLVPPLRRRAGWREGGYGAKIARVLLVWLAFRLTFESGAMKLNAPASENGQQTWRALTALKYHYETQPLPTPLSWHLNQAPLGWQKFSVLVLLTIELGAPFTMFAPARVRRGGCAAMIGLQTLIAASGNYCFFNFLTIALYVLLLDDDVWPSRWRKLARSGAEPRAGWSPGIFAPVAAVSAVVTALPLFDSMNWRIPWPVAVGQISRWVAPLRSFNGYGLFAVMTTSRPEIIVEGSHDREKWHAYEFKWKPGDVKRAPHWIAPYQPRLDWQMWFAALGSVEENPWFVQFLAGLLKGSPEVLGLLAHNPFPAAPPRYLRARLYDYRFTRAGDDQRVWWLREEKGLYCPVVSLPERDGRSRAGAAH